jgi:hypothetical protein
VVTRGSGCIATARVSRVGLAVLIGAALFARTSLGFADDGALPETPTNAARVPAAELDPQTAVTAALAQSLPSTSTVAEAAASVALDSGPTSADAAEGGSGSETARDIVAAIPTQSAFKDDSAVARVGSPADNAPDTSSSAVIAPDDAVVSRLPARLTTPARRSSADATSTGAASDGGTQYRRNTPQYRSRNSGSISRYMRRAALVESRPTPAPETPYSLPNKSFAIGLPNCRPNLSEGDLCPVTSLRVADDDDSDESGAAGSDQDGAPVSGTPDESATESTAEQLAGDIIARLPAEDIIGELVTPNARGPQSVSESASCDSSANAQGLAPIPGAGERPPPSSQVCGGSRPSSESLPGSAALPDTTEAAPVNPTRPTPDVTLGKPRGAEPAEGTGARRPSRVENQRPTGLSSLTRAGARRRLPAPHPRVRARRPLVRPATPTAGPTAAAEPARPQSVQGASRGTSDSRDQLPSIVRLAMLMFAVGLSMLVMAMVLESRATVLTTLSTRVRSRGLSARRIARHHRRGGTGVRGGIRYRD